MVDKKIVVIRVLIYLFATVTADSSYAEVAELEQAESWFNAGNYEQAEVGFKSIVADYPQTNEAFKAQKGLVILYITWDKQAQAESAFQELVGSFVGHNDLARAVNETGHKYSDLKNYEKASDCYRYVADHLPNDEEAKWSQRGLAIASVALGREDAAEAAVQQVLAEFSKAENSDYMPRVINDIAHKCREFEKYEKSRQLYQYVVDNRPEDEHGVWAQMGVVMSNIAMEADAAADAAVEKLLARFCGHKHIAKVAHDIAHHYRKLGKYEKAERLYQYVADNKPGAGQELWAQMCVAMSNIALGREAAGEIAAETMIANFNSHPGLAEAVLLVGEEYYEKAKIDSEEGRDNESKAHTEKAIALWVKIITDWPESRFALEAYNFAADGYHKLGEYEKATEYYQSVVDIYPDYEYVWHALFQKGRCYEKLLERGAVSQSEAEVKITAAYQRIVDNYPDCPAAVHARSRLEE